MCILPARVSKHGKTVEGRLALIVSFKDAIFSPARLRVCFNGGGVVGGVDAEVRRRGFPLTRRNEDRAKPWPLKAKE